MHSLIRNGSAASTCLRSVDDGQRVPKARSTANLVDEPLLGNQPLPALRK